jgi:hypothetical protein
VRGPFLLIAIVVAAVVAMTATASAQSPVGTAAGAIASLNAYRAAHGLPASIVEVSAWDAACAAHVNWMQLNHIVSHPETPGTPGYTDLGNWAGTNAVLFSGDPTQPNLWLPNTDGPWRTVVPGQPLEVSTIHVLQLLAPRLAQMGVAMSGGFICATTWPGMTGPAPAAKIVYSVPSNGESDVPYSQLGDDDQFTVIPGWTTTSVTGPFLYVFADGPADQGFADPPVTITSAQVTSASGQTVPIATVDGATPTVGSYLPPGSGIIVPMVSLEPSTRYTATVHMSSPIRGSWEYTWSFTTQPPLDPVEIDAIFLLSAGRYPARTLDIWWKSAAPNVTVSVTQLGATALIASRTANASSGKTLLTLKRAWRIGRYSVCLSSGGSATSWATTTLCRTILIALRHKVPTLISSQ